MLYCSWDMVGDGCNCCFSFWAIFCPFTPLTGQKWKFQKNEKNPGDIIILHKCTKNHDHMLHCSWNMACDTCNFYFSFWIIFYPFTPQNLPFYPTAHKIKISKKVKKGLEISSFYTCVPTIMIRWCTVPETCCMRDGWIDRWTDGQMDGKSDIKRWVPYLKKYFHKQHWLDWDLMWNNNNLKYIIKSK